MKHHYVLLGIFSFILLSAMLAVSQSTQLKTAMAMESLRHSNLAYAIQKENRGAVLGVSQGVADAGSIEIVATTQSTALKLLQENHAVVVEYTESGVVVRAIDGKGLSDGDRVRKAEWKFRVNGKEASLPADRMIVHPQDQVVWTY
jgi:hypothetical protein